MNTEIYTPKTLLEATRHFADLDVANRFMAQVRWPEGVTCPYCEGKVTPSSPRAALGPVRAARSALR